MFSAKRIKK